VLAILGEQMVRLAQAALYPRRVGHISQPVSATRSFAVTCRQRKQKGGAPLLALFEKWPAGQPTPRAVALLRGRRSDFHFEDRPVVDSYRAGFAEKVGAEATPAPQFRRLDQSALYWIAMHITQFLDALFLRPNVEVIETFLPDVLRDGVEETDL